MSLEPKDWTFGGMFRTDWKGRKVPWTRVLRERRTQTGDLNLSLAHQTSAASVAAFGGALLAAPLSLWLALGSLALFVAANARFFALLARCGGPGFAAASVVFHALHYSAALIGYLEVWLTLRRPPNR